MEIKPVILAAVVSALSSPALPALETTVHDPGETAGVERIGRYDVVWTRPSRDAAGVMPIGNGDIAAGVYAIEGGDLYLVLAKNDAFNYSGEIYKTGRVRVSLQPNPFEPGKPFRQTLDFRTASTMCRFPLYGREGPTPARTSITSAPVPLRCSACWCRKRVPRSCSCPRGRRSGMWISSCTWLAARCLLEPCRMASCSDGT